MHNLMIFFILKNDTKVDASDNGLKLASDPISSWQIDEETVETVTDFIFLGSKITADGDCSHEIRKCLLLGRKVMTNIAYSKPETLLCQQRSI